MATQQGGPSRPWLRLATMARPPPPPSAPTPQPDQPPLQPRPSFIRPTSSTRVAPPPQPPPAPTAVPSPSPQPSMARTTPSPNKEPQPRAMSPSLTSTFSPPKKEQNSPPRTISRPPSPLALPSPQLKSNQPEYEQKTMLVQEPKEKTKSFDNGDLHRHMASFLKKTESGNKHSDSEEIGIRIITIAGENKGAIMDLNPLRTKTHKLGNTEKNSDYSDSSDGDKSASDSNGKSKAKNKNQKSKSPMMNAVMNSNVQGVNNSILYNSSTTHHDPGVHLSLSRNHSGGRGSQLKERIS